METDNKIFEVLLDNAPIGIYYSDFAGRFIYGNKKAEEIVGYKKEELIGKSFLKIDLLPRTEIKKAAKLLALNKLGKSSGPDEFILVRKDGSKRSVEITTTLITVNGKKTVLGMVQDVTDHRRIQSELIKSEELHRMLVENINEVIFRCNNEGTITYMSPTIESLSGYTSSEMIGQSFTKFIHPEDLPALMESFQRTITGQLEPFEYRVLSKSGEMFWVLSHSRPIFRKKKITGLQGTLTNITELKEKGEQLKALLKEKELLIKEVYHRVKNNMQLIDSILSLQSGYVKDKSTLEVFRDTRSRIKTMTSLHKKLYQSDDLASVNCRKYIQDLTHELYRSYELSGKNIALRTDIGDDSLSVSKAIPCALIVNELVSNSFKHAFPEGQQGEVGVVMHKDDGCVFHLTVKDTGIGLPDDLDILKTDTLGMQLVTSLVEQLNGSLEVDGKSGTSYRVTFPA
ncbi:MAG: PAS domain S-box protein [Candidatus Aminicenantes bacterium]|nr:PAS domain S-box protein [Candidatus Aminicenantes bacterium]